MRLLNTKTFTFVSINDPHSVPYAILSHVWSKQGEQTYQEFLELVAEANRVSNSRHASDILTRISAKVRRCCAQALADGYEFVWIDSCCIDKTSSAELSEAINSMYTWYSCAARCYAFLKDVDDDDDPYAPASQFRSSVWFTRGWTLQELIAPALVVFLSREWNPIGTKSSLAPLIEAITGVEVDILTGVRSPSEVSVSKRMSWAAKRVTTREEDRAYSLLGLFGIHMPTIYGEGQNAFFRLQEEILRQIPDDTLFTWGRRFLVRKVSHLQCLEQQLPPWRAAYNQLFASSPSDFAHTSDFRPISHATLLQRLGLFNDNAQQVPPTYAATRFGIRAELPLLCFEDSQAGIYSGARAKVGFLLCEDARERLVAIILRDPSTYRDFTRLHDSTSSTLLVGARIPAKPCADKKRWSDHRLVAFTSDVLERIRQSGRISVTLIHISKATAHAREDPSVVTAGNPGRVCTLVFPQWRRSALAKEGFMVQEIVADSGAPHLERKHVFVLSHDVHGIVRVIIDLDAMSSSLFLQMGMLPSGSPLTTDILMGEDVSYESEVLCVEPLMRADGSAPTEGVLYPLGGGAHASGTTGTVVLLLSVTSSQSLRDVMFTLNIETVDHLSLPLVD
ncbi:HET-domain-containing protein [Ganoderma leucocontextum]|nr:HET-domain-containing protein [Ganoderma leucocontextum]